MKKGEVVGRGGILAACSLMTCDLVYALQLKRNTSSSYNLANLPILSSSHPLKRLLHRSVASCIAEEDGELVAAGCLHYWYSKCLLANYSIRSSLSIPLSYTSFDF